jgi:hypothetical protein
MALRQLLNKRSSKVEPLLFMQMMNRYFSARWSTESGHIRNLTESTRSGTFLLFEALSQPKRQSLEYRFGQHNCASFG